MEQEFVSFTVREAYTRDIGQSRVRIDYNAMDDIGVGPGDIVHVDGKKSTVARCLPLFPSDEGKGEISLDRIMRGNSGTNIGDGGVVVKKADVVVAAKNVAVEPLEASPPVGGKYLVDAFSAFPLSNGDIIRAPYFVDGLEFRVNEIVPTTGVAVVTPRTVFNVKPD